MDIFSPTHFVVFGVLFALILFPIPIINCMTLRRIAKSLEAIAKKTS